MEISGSVDGHMDDNFTTTRLLICEIFGEGRSFRGDVGKFALENTPYGLNPELAAPDPHTDPAANRQGQRDQAVVHASAATTLQQKADSLEGAITGTMTQLVEAIKRSKEARSLSRFEQLDRLAAHCGSEESNVELKRRCLRAMAEEVGLSDTAQAQTMQGSDTSVQCTTPGSVSYRQARLSEDGGAEHPQESDCLED
eukprot:CAMPEP_0117659686 /NCGR_PEP_ID=MMETSP0804-20121206/6564_1 /TAXON_ID=1074897 /ORGANISM="Tetraselmis astigmatica, Strain CCMP880" /LENGTH=197 /DNA_ID=CAMNT_0005466359 /DNA_START=248 /DNA_END=841 /DNA_ORIENTATION=+